MGTPEFAVPTLDTLYKSNHNVLEVYTQLQKNKIEVKKLIFLDS